MRNASRLFRPPGHFAVGRDESFAAALNDTVANEFSSRWRSLSLTLETITPVYGGGTIAGEVDALVPFRPRSIKNAIRHWWWQIHRHADKYVDAKTGHITLHRDMARLFGVMSDKANATGGGGLLRVQSCQLGAAQAQQGVGSRLVDYREYAQKQGKAQRDRKGRTTVLPELNYAGWPLDLDLGIPKKVLLPGVSFRVTFACPRTDPRRQDADLAADVEELQLAIQAWIIFGGIGSRTSRGFGRIRCLESTGDFAANVKLRCCNESLKQYPRFASHIGSDRFKDAEQAWFAAIGLFHEFRQARGPTSAGSRNRFNRSYLPTGDSIRAWTAKKGYSEVRYPTPPEAQRVDKRYSAFPSLMFGAPVPFKFIPITSRQAPRGRQFTEPGEGVLNWTRVLHKNATQDTMKALTDVDIADRYASPVLVTVAEMEDGSYAPMTLLLANSIGQERDLAGRGAVIQISKEKPIQLSRERTWPADADDASNIWRSIPKPRSRDPNDPVALRKQFDDGLRSELVKLADAANPSAVWAAFFESRLGASAGPTVTGPTESGSPSTTAVGGRGSDAFLDADSRRRLFASQRGEPRRRDGEL